MKALPDELCDLEATNEAFRVEVKTYNFHYRCSSCAHVLRASHLCSLGYPNHYLVDDEIVVQTDGNLTFCKYFEIGETLHVPDL